MNAMFAMLTASTPTPAAYTEPPYTPVQPDEGMILLYAGIAVLLAIVGAGIYLYLKNKTPETAEPKPMNKED